MKQKKVQSENRGFSLVELLIAMTLGLILISSMIAVFSGNKRSSELNSATADLQESARYALEQISRDARLAGFSGCLKVDYANAVNVVADTPPTTDLNTTVTTGAVVDNWFQWQPSIPGLNAPVSNRSKPGTHVLMLQYGGPDTTGLVTEMLDGGLPSRAVDIETYGNPNLDVGDLALITNCEFGDLFRITSVGTIGTSTVFGHSTANNSTGAFSRSYGSSLSISETRIMKFQSNVYYIGENGQTTDTGQPIYSLFQQSLPYNDGSNPAVELITGVENFRVAFGIRDNITGGVRYMGADDPLFDPTRVDSIRLGILMVSHDEVADVDDTNTYFLAGQPIAPAGGGVAENESHPIDRRIRLAFTTTVTLRNRTSL